MGDEARLEWGTPEERFARNLRERREAMGLSQAELAERMVEAGHAFHQQTIARVENGTRAVRLNEAEQFARVVNSTVADLTRQPAEAVAAHLLESRSTDTYRAHQVVVAAIKDLWNARIALEAQIEQIENPRGSLDQEALEKPLTSAKARLQMSTPEYAVEFALMEFEGKFGRQGPGRGTGLRLKELLDQVKDKQVTDGES
ncbi:helix-turn-helix transcriptional regulator [Actinomadura sp. HBU206391]|uniref:helix-turn-helix transcriptional regulator n=1 Tax=Actinomadura sp. HBU206391 TaxID=2731692 RepID=UPI001650C26F|nr:helix-turn-helix transcriptional regulator [Actinomadura sp. HBU206391]MBC6462620.1 helix-turn-helix transcriptional regulator [Actinomadura sp. HBU206391]